MLSKELLDILACPSCKGDLEYDQENEKLVCNGEHCPECGYPLNENKKCTNDDCGAVAESTVRLKYSIRDDIPIMLINEAERF